MRSYTRVVHANSIDKAAHFGGPQQRRKALKYNVCFDNSGLQACMVAISSTGELMQNMPQAELRKCYKKQWFLTIL